MALVRHAGGPGPGRRWAMPPSPEAVAWPDRWEEADASRRLRGIRRAERHPVPPLSRSPGPPLPRRPGVLALFFRALALSAFAAALPLAAAARAEPVDLVPYAGPPAPPPSLDVPLLTLSGPPLAQTRTVPDAGTDVLVVHFFATWCEPCRAELPALSRLSARLPGVRVVLVDVAEPEARVRRFFEEVVPPGPILMDQDRAAVRAFGVEILPSTLVFAAGVPRLRAVGEVAWDDPKVAAQLSALGPGGAGTNAAGKNGS